MITTHIGIMPLPIAQEYEVNYTRVPIFIEKPIIANTGDHRLLLNINHDIHFPYEKDLDKYKQQLLNIPLSVIKPKLIAVENEEMRDPARGSIEDYLNELRTAIDTLPEHKITNGGFVLPLYYWYWQQTKDNDFFQYCVPDSAKHSLTAGLLSERIDTTAYELDVLKGLKIAFVNIHYYMRNANEVEPLIRMINYVKEYTGKPVISNEAGVYQESLLPNVVEVARRTEMKYLIFYSGTGKVGQMPPMALPISKTDYLNAVK